MTLFKLSKACSYVVYGALKLLPTNPRKVVFLSRQADTPSIDAKLVIAELKRRSSDVVAVTMCKRDESTLGNHVALIWFMIASMYHLATSKVCVLDSFWPMTSFLKHKEDLKIIQMWHSIAKVKQSGLITVGRPGGRSTEVAKVLRMHEGYDFVIAGGKAWNQFYCESFGITEDVIRNVGLPRIDYLIDNRDRVREEFFEKHPELQEKPIVLYAPTFRRSGDAGVEDLLAAFDYERFNLVVKAHPNQKIDVAGYPVHTCPEFTAREMLLVSAFVVTDYSAIAAEAAAVDVRTAYYVHDYDQYARDNGLNIDLFEVMPGCVFRDARDVVAILGDSYPQEAFERYKETYLFDGLGHSAEAIADVIINEAGLLCEAK